MTNGQSNNDVKQLASDSKLSTSGTFYDYQLVGDDFFLALATAEMGLKYTKSELFLSAANASILIIIFFSFRFFFADGKIRQCGLCVSGQTIRGATKRIEATSTFEKQSIIINVGSVDILHGHDLVDMRYDFAQLLDTCVQKNLVPIITTLAPLANANHTPEVREKLIAFNSFLWDRYFLQYQIIDIHTLMVTPRGTTLYDCYQP